MLCYNLSLLNRDYRVMPAKLLVSPLHSVPVVHTQSAHTGSSQLVTLWKKWPLQGSHLLRGTESVREGRDLSKWWFFDRNPVLYLQTQSFSAGQPAFLQLCLTVFMKRPEPGSGGIGELKDLWRSWPFTVTWSQGPAVQKAWTSELSRWRCKSWFWFVYLWPCANPLASLSLMRARLWTGIRPWAGGVAEAE